MSVKINNSIKLFAGLQKLKKTEIENKTLKFKVMKTIKLRFAIIAVLFFVSSVSFAVKTGSKNNEFEITPIENLHLGNSIEKVWTINYSELEKPVTITSRTTATGKEYVVRSNYLEVVYAMDNKGFGVKKMGNSTKEVPEMLASSILNKKEMNAQRILTTNQVSDAIALELIAIHLPDLLNDPYLHLIL
jgi:hypothetical protein